MAECPVCESERVVIVLDPRPRALCPRCGTTWIRQGAEQRSLSPLNGSSFNIVGVSVDRVPQPAVARRGGSS